MKGFFSVFLRLALPGLAAVAGCDTRATPARPASNAVATAVASVAPRFLKGQLHAHTDGSGDSDTPAAEAAAWYADHGFDFVVFTDHNRITETRAPGGMLTIRGVELTQNLRRCEPAPGPGEACLLHVNALFVGPSPGRITLESPMILARTELYGRAVDRAIALGGIAQLNHPNFQHGADLEVLVALAARGLTLVEIENRAVDSGNEGDAEHASTEALWDAALLRGAHVLGTATDDAHHYGDAAAARARGETAYVGDRGFVMVRAAKNEAAIRAAIVAGDFYGSTGIVLDRLDLTPESVAVDARPSDAEATIEILVDGRIVASEHGPSLRFDPRTQHGKYLRVRVTDTAGRKAFSQPLWLAPK
ncbi:MAG: hypothetical protein ABJE95_26270 [Byssovorax sp.]